MTPPNDPARDPGTHGADGAPGSSIVGPGLGDSETEPAAHREAGVPEIAGEQPVAISLAQADTTQTDAADGQSPADPWAHRRGEPRVFAFLWAMYVFLAVGGGMLWLAGLHSASTAYSPAARTMLVVLAAGVTLLWPMTRLCQAPAWEEPHLPPGDPGPSGVVAALADLVVVLFPLQLVVWPIAVLAQWPLSVVAAVAMLLAVWAVVVGGVLALAFASRRSPPGPRARTAWMAGIVAVVMLPALGAMFVPEALPRAAAAVRTVSPFTGVYALTGTGWAGPQAALQTAHWRALQGTAGVGLLLWAAACTRAAAGTRREFRLH